MRFFSTLFPSALRQRKGKFKTFILLAVILLTACYHSSAQIVYALSGQVLTAFDLAAPGTAQSSTVITGIAAGQTIEGLDCRPNTGQLYALGYNQTTGEARLYTVDAVSGIATAVGMAPVTLQPNMGEINFDFNPTVDRIRVTGSNAANYRLHPVTGAIAATDGSLAYAASDANAGATPFISAAAYTNSYIASSATTLYNYDAALNILTNQNPPNNGTLNTIGASGITATVSDKVDMDIYFDKVTQTNTALMVVTNTALSSCSFYTVNLATGSATSLLPFPLPIAIQDIAFQIDRTVPAQVTGQLMYAVTANNNLISFDSDVPDIIRSITPVTGITAGQIIEGIDFRPATGELYAIGYVQSTGDARLYTINLVSGAATAVGMAPVTLQPNMGEVNFDFNPTVDRIRVTGSNNANYRLHPVTGAIAATDGALSFATGDLNVGADPLIAACAYTNSYFGASSTTLFTYDALLNIVATQIPPNNGTLNTIGLSGIAVNPLDPAVDMDVAFNAVSQTNAAYICATPLLASASSLYKISLASGNATAVGLIGISTQVNDIAAFIKPQVVPAQVTGQLVYAVTANNSLISFDSDKPDVIRSLVALTGIAAGQAVEGIDFRPATGELYAIGYNQTSGETRLYTINLTSGVMTAIGAAPVVLPSNMGEVNFDFNPTVDRIRVTGSNGANYRLHPVTGAIAATDGTLAYAVGDINTGVSPLIAAGAYTNSFFGAATTTLYNYDGNLNVITTQVPPNNGILNTIGVTGIAVDPANPAVDMDIFFNATTQTNLALVSATSFLANGSVLYTVNLATGAVTTIDTIGIATQVNDIAIYINRTVPAQITGKLVYAISGNNSLLSFDSDLPGVIRSVTPVTGFNAAQPIAGLDFRPATGELFAIGYNNTSGMARLYTIAIGTGSATAVGVDSFMLQAGMGAISFDFNPTVDRIRVTGANGANYRLNPITGGIAATDISLAYATTDVNAGAMPQVGAVAYINSYNGTTTTSLYNYDYALNVLTNQTPPNNGTLNTIGSTGITVNAAMPTIDMDVHYSYTNNTNVAFLNANTGTSAFDQLYTVNLSTGAVTSNGFIGLGIPVKNIAVVLDTAPAVPTITYTAHLTGHQQVFPVATAGSGDISAALTGNTLVVTGSFSGLAGPIDLDIAGGAHIHSGYAGQNGSIELNLVPLPSLDSTGGSFIAALNTFQLTPAQAQLLKDRKLYVNIHSHAYAGGEIRGQLLPVANSYFTSSLFGSNQVPSLLTNGSGALALELRNDTLVVSGSFDHLTGDFATDIAGGAHLHTGLPGSTGGVTLLLNATVNPDLHGGVFPAGTNSFVLNADQKAALFAGELYANIHTETNESGEIRGQINGSANAVFRAHLSGANQYPFVTTMGTGQVLAELKGSTLVVTGSFTQLEGAVDTNILGGAHIHIGLAGSSGAVDIELNATFDADGKGGAFYAADNTFTLDADAVQALLDRAYYVNIHTSAYPSGEIRGQLLLESQAAFTAFLTGSQGVPDVSTTGHGAVAAEISGNRLTLSGSFSELGSPINLAIVDGSHVHAGLPGSTGAVQFPLAATLDSDLLGGIYAASANTYTLTDEQKAMLMARGLYVNIHSLLEPDGEIRGNFLAEASAYFFAPMSGASQTIPVNVGATGLMAIEVNDQQLVAVGSFNGLENNFDPTIADGAHLHQQFAGSNGDVKTVLNVDADADLRGGAFQAAGNAYAVSTGFIDTLRQRMIYANIHTTGNAGGEIRGQLMPMAGAYFHTSLAGINAAPAVATDAAGSLKLELNGNILTCTGSFANLTGNFDPNVAGGAHIHNAATGNAGGIALNLATTADANLKGGVFTAAQNQFVLSANQIDMLRNSELYANIHTTTNAGGEIRGQLLAETNLFPGAPAVLLPVPGGTINVEGLPTDLVNITWTPSVDPEGDKVIYVWQVALDANFDNILFMKSTDVDAFTTLTLAELDALLTANGVPLGITVSVFHRVVATDGSNATASASTTVKLKRGVVSGTDEILVKTFAVSVQPNITLGQPVNVLIDARQQTDAKLLVTNNLGQIASTLLINVTEGTQQFSIDFSKYAPGVYYLTLSTEKGILPAIRVFKQ